MSTNASKKIIKQEATRKGCGKVLFDKDAMTNLRLLSEMVKRGHHIVLDTAIENAFYVTSPDGKFSKYVCNSKGLCSVSRRRVSSGGRVYTLRGGASKES